MRSSINKKATVTPAKEQTAARTHQTTIITTEDRKNPTVLLQKLAGCVGLIASDDLFRLLGASMAADTSQVITPSADGQLATRLISKSA